MLQMYNLHCEKQASTQAISIDEQYIPIDAQTTLYCKVVGKGKPLIIVHGGPGLSSDYLQPQMLELAHDHQLIFYDQRACGKSTGIINQNTMQIDKFVEDLAVIQQHFNLPTVSLMGHSWGALLALKYASVHADKLDRLILLNPIPIYSSPKTEPDMYESMIQRMIAMGDNAEAILQEYRNTFTYFFADQKKCKELNLTMSPQAAINSARIHDIFEKGDFANYDLRAAVKDLTIPTSVLYGKSNDLPASVSQDIVKAMKNARCEAEALPCGHFPYVEVPDMLMERMSAFLREGHVAKIPR